MNPEHQQRLERDIDRVLKSLPEIQAPEHLLSRVMARIEVDGRQALVSALVVRSGRRQPGSSPLVLPCPAVFAGLCYFVWIAPEIQFLQPLLAKAPIRGRHRRRPLECCGGAARVYRHRFPPAWHGGLMGSPPWCCSATRSLSVWELCISVSPSRDDERNESMITYRNSKPFWLPAGWWLGTD